MNKNSRLLAMSVIFAASLAWAIPALAQASSEGVPGEGDARPRQTTAGLFGGGAFSGGYLKYTYDITRQGSGRASTTTTEITPQADGTYSIVSSSTENVPLDMVHIGFFGIALPRLGIHVSENTTGTIDLSPLSNITGSAMEPGKNYILPDGGRFQAGATGTIAGLDVVYGTYTHADYSNVVILLAFATDLTIRSMMPFPAMMEFRYSTTSSTENQPLEMFSTVKLSEFVYRP
jgi:hypothetical protein